MNTATTTHSGNADGMGLEQTCWWPDTISSLYPFINRFPASQQLSGVATLHTSERYHPMNTNIEHLKGNPKNEL
ncbi:unnamed protein product [Gongylonema pulchrum]|uniref:Uncharacterized protein n=1 Tax=Gongylonema pulchrum TaxID=637853 RepID=A0A183F0Y1_9BILA|nr:unnamed protein product [Gongylonema pulchrum]